MSSTDATRRDGLRIVFAGSPTAAVASLQALLGTGHQLVAVVSRRDSVQGRRRVVASTPVAAAAEAADIPVIKTNRLDEAATTAIAALAPDLGVIVAYGGLVSEPLLSLPRLGWINLHFSLLPRWRGAAPVQRAIMAGDTLTGATVFRLVEDLDAGDVYGRLTERIGGDQTAGMLLETLARRGAGLLVDVVDAIAAGSARPEPQSGAVTLAPRLTVEDGRIDFAATAAAVHNLIRGVSPEPGAFTVVDGSRLKVLQAAVTADAGRLPAGRLELVVRRLLVGTATEPLELITVHPAGKNAMSAVDWWRGRSHHGPVFIDTPAGASSGSDE